MPRSLRLVLSAELCASLAAHDPPDLADTELPLLLQQAFREAMSDRCTTLELRTAALIMATWCHHLCPCLFIKTRPLLFIAMLRSV